MRAVQQNRIFEEVLEIADDASQDFKTVIKNGAEVRVFDHEYVQRAKLRIDARKWMATKLTPKKYGNKVGVSSGVAITIMISQDDLAF